MNLTMKDYDTIIQYYNIDPSSFKRKEIKNVCEKILAEKLCRCIKKVPFKDEKTSIAICRNSIFNRRNLKISSFTCKKKARLLKNKQTKKSLLKNGKLKFKIKNKSNKSKIKSKIK